MNVLRIAIVLIAISQTVAAQRQEPATASLEGAVTKAGSTSALARVNVELRGVNGGSLFTATDVDGKFSFLNVTPGRYRVIAGRTGYATAEYGQRGVNGPGLPITIAAAQRLTGLQIAMTPTGAISGIITDSTGHLLANATVQALKVQYQNGQRALTVFKSVRTDDLGAYRLFWLTPGFYYVNVIVPGNRDYQSSGLVAYPNGAGGGGRTFLVWDDPLVLARPFDSLVDESETYVPIYFPSTADMVKASVVEVLPESDTMGINISALTVRTARLRGVTLDAATAQPVGSVQLGLLSANPSVPANYAVASDPMTGAFNFPKVIPGSYLIVARTGTGMFGSASVDLSERDAKDVSVMLAPGVDIRGSVLIDSPPPGLNMAGIGVSLVQYPFVPGQASLTVPVQGGTSRQGISAPSAVVRSISPDGTFTITGVPSGEYRVFVIPILIPQLPPGTPAPSMPPALQSAFVKSIRFGEADALDGVLRVGPRVEGQLQITIGMNSGSVEGQSTNEARQPAVGSTIVLLPEASRRFRVDLYRTTIADATGRFQFGNIPPGAYAVFAWDDIETGSWHEPEFMRRVEERGIRIQVTEGGTATVDVQAIPKR